LLNRLKNPEKRKLRGETILEVIIALFIVATGSTAATSLIVNSMQSNGLSRDNLIALNLAVEGLEAVRDIRDTNWLRFNFNKTQCWNEWPDTTSCDGSLIGDARYNPHFDPGTMKWTFKLSGLSSIPDDLTTNSNSCLYYYDLDKTKEIDPSMDDDDVIDNDRDIIDDNYTPSASGNILKLSCSGFYRIVNIAYTAGTGSPILAANATEMTVTSIVQWKTNGRVSQVRLTTKLTNYQKVKVT
jgi:type II secretory pathway pseudopilin PulG